jgi:histidine ammonia-lyase
MTRQQAVLRLDGSNLDCRQLWWAAFEDPWIELSDRGWSRIRAARDVVEEVLASGQEAYGLTTGLGAKLSDKVSAEDAARFAQDALRGRAHAVGNVLPGPWVRAAILARLNSFCIGASGIRPSVVAQILDALNAGLLPVLRDTGSVGAGDLCWNAAMMLPFTGGGRFTDRKGVCGDAAELLQSHGLKAFEPAPGEALALANHSSLSAGLGGLAVAGMSHALARFEGAAALSLEAFGANLSPFAKGIRRLRGLPGEERAARRMAGFLEGSRLNHPGAARRLQDPLSLRNCLQVHGACWSSLDFARSIAEAELNGAGDNPAVVIEERRIRSSGNLLTNQLSLGLGTLQRAMAELATSALARIAVLQASRFTGLPALLAKPGSGGNGIAPLTKIAEALAVEIHHLGSAPPHWPSLCADGVEDLHSNAALAAKNALLTLPKLRCLGAVEFLAAAQALDLQDATPLGDTLARLQSRIRAISPMIAEGRPLSEDIMRLADDAEIDLICRAQA